MPKAHRVYETRVVNPNFMINKADLVLSLGCLSLTLPALTLGLGGCFGLCFGFRGTTATARSIRGRAG